jgi:hypothetical protein
LSFNNAQRTMLRSVALYPCSQTLSLFAVLSLKTDNMVHMKGVVLHLLPVGSLLVLWSRSSRQRWIFGRSWQQSPRRYTSIWHPERCSGTLAASIAVLLFFSPASRRTGRLCRLNRHRMTQLLHFINTILSRHVAFDSPRLSRLLIAYRFSHNAARFLSLPADVLLAPLLLLHDAIIPRRIHRPIAD